MFRYIRYNALGLRRSALKRDDETTATVADVTPRTPRRATRLGTLDPETSRIIWQDAAVDATGVTPLGLEASLANPVALGPEPQIEGA